MRLTSFEMDSPMLFAPSAPILFRLVTRERGEMREWTGRVVHIRGKGEIDWRGVPDSRNESDMRIKGASDRRLLSPMIRNIRRDREGSDERRTGAPTPRAEIGSHRAEESVT